MKLTYLSDTFFPFLVPEMDASFASSVGPQTVYPAGFQPRPSAADLLARAELSR